MRVAVVTGGTRGIGEAISLKLQEKGRTVIANYGGNDAAAQEFSARTGIAVRKWDVGDHQSCIDGCAAIEAEFGPIDIMVNNAGITRDATMVRMTFEQWDEVIRVDLTGCFNMAKATFPGMRERRWGRIVNVGSVNGQGGQIGPDLSAIARGADREKLMQSILHPSRDIAPEFVAHTLTTKDNQEFTGLLIGQSVNEGVTLFMADGRAVLIPPALIESQTQSQVSLMPEGLVSALTVQDFRDLLAFLLSRR